ncbi:histidine kinase [Leucobacter sp. HY1910]
MSEPALLSDTAPLSNTTGPTGPADPADPATTTSGSGWVRPRATRETLRFDAGLAAVLAVAAVTTSLLYARTGIYEHPAPLWVSVLGLGLVTLPLALRRVWPVPVAVLAALGFFICGQFAVPELLITNIGLFIALYTVGSWEPRRALAFWIRCGISAAMILWLVVALIIASSDVDAMPGVSRSGLFSAFATYSVIQIITNLLYFGGAFYFGDRSWQSARMRARLEAQGRELELERRTSAEQAVALDRIAIARELHDVVAHHVSVMGIQAGAARRLVERAEAGAGVSRGAGAGSGTAELARAAAALEVVESSAETAIAELRGLVGTLRAPETGDAATTIGIAQLPALVAASAAAGLPATLIVAGEARPVPMLVDVALYRTAQEALTNARKHAGVGAEATVRLRFEARAVELEVGDTGTAQRLGAGGFSGGAAAGVGAGSTGAGLGLRGMRERVGAVGGTVETMRREGGGFLVRARVPLGVAPASGTSGLSGLSGASDSAGGARLADTPESSSIILGGRA